MNFVQSLSTLHKVILRPFIFSLTLLIVAPQIAGSATSSLPESSSAEASGKALGTSEFLPNHHAEKSLPARQLAKVIPDPLVRQTNSGSSPRRQLRVGLALAGGGTRGCAHIGVLRALEKAGLKIDCIAGTSMGAIVGGLYASGVSIDDIEQLIMSKKLVHGYDTVPIPVRIAVVPLFFIPHIFGYHPYDGLYRGGVFAKFIRNSAPEGYRDIENFKIPFAAVASNVLDGKPYAIKDGCIGKALQASSAIPFLRRPVEIGDKLFIDGGIVMNLPVDQAREIGADFVIAVNVDDDLVHLQKKDFRKIGSVATRAMNMHLSAIDRTQEKKADFIIHPDVTGIDLLSRNLKDARRAISSGEQETDQLMSALKKKIEEQQVSIADKQAEKSTVKGEHIQND